LHHLPLTSRVLLRRDGYREMLDLWRRFHQARRPLFAPLQHALATNVVVLRLTPRQSRIIEAVIGLISFFMLQLG
jgi:hypothetical protein